MTTSHTSTHPTNKPTFTAKEVRAIRPELSGYSDEQIESTLSELQAHKKAELLARQREGIRRKIESGQQYGAAPIGYINRREGDRTWVEPDPETYPLVQEARELHATGKYSLRQLCIVMTEKGLRSRNGKTVGPSAMKWMLDHSTKDLIQNTEIVRSVQEIAKSQYPFR